ncbi:hypothetical protein I4U23_009907 [Adineta vaga]|nr:hypothetical protein I4U23_009907 [Adineta vaga]
MISNEPTSLENTSYIPEPDISLHQCQLSMSESDGWFCESDSDWKRRKTIHRSQNKRSHYSNQRDMFFFNWEPTIHCEFERRIGNTGDGGKWICDIHRFQQMNDTNLLIYSFGCNEEFSFEQAIKKELPNVEIHTFDTGSYQCPDDVCTYHRARLGGGNDDGTKSIQMIMKELGHEKRQIHILKVDIEGSEYELFETLFRRSKAKRKRIPYVRQILFEIHLGDDEYDIESVQRAHRFFELFRENNYAIFHKEPNLSSAKNVHEYGMIRLNPAFFN